MIRRLTTWLRDRPRREAYAYLGLMAFALVLRFIDLGERPYHHDESQDAYFSWVFYDRGDYEYQPILHGPLRFYLTAFGFLLFGDSDFTGRLMPALMGTLIVGLPYLLRRQIGGLAAFATAVLLAIGPTYLYFSRFAREDIYITTINFALVIAVFRFLDRPRTAGPAIVLGLLAAAFATKETTYITVFIAGAFFLPSLGVVVGLVTAVVAGLVGGLLLDDVALTIIVAASLLVCTAGWEIARRVGERPDRVLRDRVASVGWAGWGYGFAALAIVFSVLFTVFLTNPPGLWDGIHDSLAYWIDQQPVRRGGEPWYFYIVVLVAHEWPVLLLGAVGAGVALARPSTLRLFLLWAFVGSMAVYGWASEKFAWLAMHPLLPLLILAGIGVQTIWAERRPILRFGGLTLVAIGFAYSAWASFLVNAKHRADPREFLVSTQSSEDVRRVVQRVRDVSRSVEERTGSAVTIHVDSSSGATFPWAWYFRDLPIGYVDMTLDGYVPSKAQVLLMTEQARQKLIPDLVAYDAQRFRFRVWWVRDWTRKLDVGAWTDWYVDREPWNPVGGMQEWVYVRRDAEIR